MRISRRIICSLMAAVMACALLPAFCLAANAWTAPGNSDLNILNGGVMLRDGGDFYFNHGGIFIERNERVTALSADDGRNLNLAGGYLYYTVGAQVCRIPKTGGEREIIHTASADIKQLYVMGETLSYIAGGAHYIAAIGGIARTASNLTGVMGLIPTQYGDLLLTGEVLNYTLWANGQAILSGVQSCYTDSGFLAVEIDNRNYMAKLSSLFSGFNSSMLEDFSIHGDIALMELLSPDDENAVSEDNDNNKLMLDFEALLSEAGLNTSMRLMAVDPNTGEVIIPSVSQGQINMVKRARQLHEIEWTPLENRSQWGDRGVFYAETTYTGIPYGQPVNSNGYIGYGVSIDAYAASVLDNTSKFYTSYSTYNKIAPVYSTDCSGFVSYAWGTSPRYTTYSLPNIAEKVGDQSVYSLQVGDALNHQVSHVVLVSGVRYDGEGNINWVEIMEQTPVITKLTRYGAGESRPLASLQSYYLNGGYVIYRNPKRDAVTYTPNANVPLDGEAVAGQKDRAPKSKTTPIEAGKTVALSNDGGAPIYYTTDGSAPSTSSNRYSSPISFYDTTKLRAIAVSGNYSGSTILEYTVKVPQLAAPTFSVPDGTSANGYILSGTKLTISSVSGATIYYTTDGTEPTTNSSKYSSPITVSSDITIKAMAAANGYKNSSAASVGYKLGSAFTITASAGANGSISPPGSSSVVQTGSKTYTITPNNGYKVDVVLVDGASVGAVSAYTFSNVTGNHTISATFKSTAVLPYTDLVAGAWYHDAVNHAHTNSLFKGVSANSFAPDMTMTRGMFITVLGRFAGISDSLNGKNIGVVTGADVNIRKGPSTDTEVAGVVRNRYSVVEIVGKSGDWYQISYGSVSGYIRGDFIKTYSGNYSDLTSSNYYSVFAQWACLSGVADGVASATFNGEDDISREDMSLLLYNYSQISGRKLPSDIERTTFSDDAQIGAAAKTAVYALQQAGVIQGIGANTFSPKGTATRAHVAQIYMNFAKAVS